MVFQHKCNKHGFGLYGGVNLPSGLIGNRCIPATIEETTTKRPGPEIDRFVPRQQIDQRFFTVPTMSPPTSRSPRNPLR
jgi:hypothetical protein